MCVKDDQLKKSASGFLAGLDDHRKVFLMALVLALITFAVFAPAIRFHFVNYDDDLYVYANRQVLDGLKPSGLIYAFTAVDGGNWMPLTWLSFQLDATLFGRAPAGYHLTNIVLHCSNVMLLFLVLRRMTKTFWRSALVALLFAVHPLRQESVVWVSERKDVLSTFFWLLGLLAYASYVEKRLISRYCLMTICLVFGLMSKAMLVTFPFALLLLDVWPLRRVVLTEPDLRAKLWPLFLEKIPFLLPCLAMVAITFWSQHQVGAIGVAPHSGLKVILHVFDNYAVYLRNIFWPAQLTITYPTEVITWTRALSTGGLIVVISFTAVWLCRSVPWLAAGWFWFLGTFIPVIGFNQLGHTFVADRYTYVPFIGVAVIVAWAMGDLVRVFPAWRRSVIVAAVLGCFLTTAINRATLFRWQDSVALFTDATRKGLHPIACNNLASALDDSGNYAAAIQYADLAIALQTNNALAYVTRGMAYVSKGDLDAALTNMTRAIELNPNFVKAWNNRSYIWYSKSNYAAAISDSTRAIEMEPDNALAYNNRGNIFIKMGDHQRAVDDYSRAIALNPYFAMAYNNRAAAYLGMNELVKAQTDGEKCRQLGGQLDAGVVEALLKITAPK